MIWELSGVGLQHIHVSFATRQTPEDAATDDWCKKVYKSHKTHFFEAMATSEA
jgi:hypothetical protein